MLFNKPWQGFRFQRLLFKQMFQSIIKKKHPYHLNYFKRIAQRAIWTITVRVSVKENVSYQTVFLPQSICLHHDLCVYTSDLERDPSVTVPVSHSHLSILSRWQRYMGWPIISPAPEHTALSKVIDYFIIYSHLKAGRLALMANGKGTQVSVHARPTGKQTVLRSMTLTKKWLTTLIFRKV